MFSTGTHVVRRNAVSTLSCNAEKVAATTARQNPPSASGPAGRNPALGTNTKNPTASSTATEPDAR